MTHARPEDEGGKDDLKTRALEQVDEALRTMSDAPDQVAEVVTRALLTAQEALIDGLSECRQLTPYAPIIQVGDSQGLHYECTHRPSHRY